MPFAVTACGSLPINVSHRKQLTPIYYNFHTKQIVEYLKYLATAHQPDETERDQQPTLTYMDDSVAFSIQLRMRPSYGFQRI